MNKFIGILVVVISLSSCNFYKPAVLNAPILEEKRELNVGVSLGNSADINLSYALSNNVGAMANFSTMGNVEVETTNSMGFPENYTFKNNKYEGALGYYNSKDDKFFYNFYLGYAIGNAGSLADEIFFPQLTGGYSADFKGLFAQTSIHGRLDDEKFLGLIFRLNQFKFYDFNYSFDPSVSERYLVKDPNNLIGQVALDLNIKGDIVGGFGQIQYAFVDNTEAYMSLRNIGIHAGVYFRLFEFFK